MRLRTGYGLKEKMSDTKKLTLLLEWQYLTTAEAKAIWPQVEQVVRTLLQEQKMLFAGTVNCGRQKWLHGSIPWKGKDNVNINVQGFVRTEETSFVQKHRINRLLREKRRSMSFRAVQYSPIPYLDVTKEQGLEMVQKYLDADPKKEFVQALQEEVTIGFRQKHGADGTYNISVSISISGYAIGYALHDLAAEYKAQILAVSQRTPLFAGYIFYENTPKGTYAYFHSFPSKMNGKPVRSFGLSGYEWAAYLHQELAKEVSAEQMEQLRQLADVTFTENGIFYQMRCDILQYGLAEKQRCREILEPLLQPRYGYVSFADLFAGQMQIPQTKVYLLKPRWSKDKHCSILGFYSKTTPEESETGRLYTVLEEIEIPY